MVYFSVSVLFALAQSTTVPAPPAAGGASSQAAPASPAEVITPKDAKERMDWHGRSTACSGWTFGGI
jgi:hypothetical protein